jgi:hypothetical protein
LHQTPVSLNIHHHPANTNAFVNMFSRVVPHSHIHNASVSASDSAGHLTHDSADLNSEINKIRYSGHRIQRGFLLQSFPFALFDELYLLSGQLGFL